MHRKTFYIPVILAAALFCFVLAGAAQAKKPAYLWKAGTLAPKGVGWAKQVEEVLIPTIDRVTDKDLAIKVYWGGIMGDDEDYIKKMRIGQLQVGGLTAQGAVMISPEWYVTEIPFLFNGYDEVDYVKPKMFDTFDRDMQKKGFKLIIWIDQDFDQTYSVKRSLEKPEDFRGVRFVTWYGELEQNVLERLGAITIPINVPEVSASIRAGIADANLAPAIWMVGSQMYSISRFVNTMNLRYAPALICVTMDAWKEIPEAYRKKIELEREDLTKRFVAGTRRDNAKCLDAMIGYGMKKANVTPENLERFKKMLAPVGPEMAGKLYTKAIYDELLSNLAEYRSQKGASKQ
ncbi:MAG: TRAP transporter substrate-binding protein DctP [Thermodesulfobacteriota bacterium]